MKTLIMYKDDGRIFFTLRAPLKIIEGSYLTDDLKNYFIVDEVINTPSKYVVNNNNELEMKTEYTGIKYDPVVAVGDQIRVSGILKGSDVVWPDKFGGVINDGFAETLATVEGEYVFIIDHPYHHPIEVVINATA